MKEKNTETRRDPAFEREAQRYAKPIASREYILAILEKASGPLTHKQMCRVLEFDDEDDIEALRRRLIAMVRDGQLFANRKDAYAPVNKLDLVKGRVLAHRDGYGFLRPYEGGEDIYLTNRQMRKVFDGDEVIVRKGEKNFRGQTEGAIVEVLKRNTTHLVGQLVHDGNYCFLNPDNPKVHHDIVIDAAQTLGAENGQIVLVELLQQPGRHQRAQGKVVEILGDHLAPGMEIDVAIRSYGIPHIWPEKVLEEAQVFDREVAESDKEARIDLRHLSFVTIDGEDARDFDDAVYCEKKRSGGWRLYVAIADVSHYVLPGSALDEEALQRGNSVYFPNQVVPMLPEALSNGLCSLNPKVDRLCMVCEMTISSAGKISGYHFYEAVMHSRERLTYTDVGKMLSAAEGAKALRKKYSAITPALDELHALYKALLKTRQERGAIDFDTVETRMIFGESRKIESIIPVRRNDAHRLIEECMLAANVCAARFMEAHKLPALYRVHEAPKAEKLELLQTYLAELGLHMPGRERVVPQDYQDLMQQAAGRSDAHLIQTVMLRSMNQALYQATNLGHFGLAYPAYAHFTSPIRRYPDLLIHRALRRVIRSKDPSKRVRRVPDASLLKPKDSYPYTDADMDRFGEQCSHTERRADEATRDVQTWLKCEFLQDRVGEVFEGVISAVTSFGLFVELSDLYVEGLIHISSLPHDYYHYSAAHHRLVGERSRRSFHLGDRLSVRVVRVNLEERKADFELVDALEKKVARPPQKRKNVDFNSPEDAASERKPRKRATQKASSEPGGKNKPSGDEPVAKKKKDKSSKKKKTKAKKKT